jgi:hypothetical protein
VISRFARELAGGDGLRACRHHVFDARFQEVGPHVPAQIAIGDDAGELALAVDDADAAEALGGNLHHGRAHARAKLRQRHGVALVHDVADEFQLRAELAARMQHPEIDRGEAAAFQERNGERVAERELHQG